jgi:uncharacterized protein
MSTFTPLAATAGGLLIGAAAVLLLALNGRIAGVSGVAAGLVSRRTLGQPGERAWRLLFLLGLVLGAGGWFALSGRTPALRQGFPPALLVLAGLLVGYGTALAGGCTSGHGVCGLARWSLRSLVAVGVFLGVAIATTFVVRHVLGVAS